MPLTHLADLKSKDHCYNIAQETLDVLLGPPKLGDSNSVTPLHPLIVINAPPPQEMPCLHKRSCSKSVTFVGDIDLKKIEKWLMKMCRQAICFLVSKYA